MLYDFRQSKKLENRLRHDAVTESLKVGILLIHSVYDMLYSIWSVCLGDATGTADGRTSTC